MNQKFPKNSTLAEKTVTKQRYQLSKMYVNCFMEISFEGDVTLVVCSLTEKRLFTHFVYGRPTKTNMGPASYIQELMMAYQFLAEIFSRVRNTCSPSRLLESSSTKSRSRIARSRCSKHTSEN